MIEGFLPDEAATLGCGAALAAVLTPGLVIALHGDLGSGKTTLTRGILRALGHAGKVKSPTYTLVEPYQISRLDLYHFDFFRLKDESEWLSSGFDEYFDGRAICLVEWPEKAGASLPPADLDITLVAAPDPGDATSIGRHITITARTEQGRRCLNALRPLD